MKRYLILFAITGISIVGIYMFSASFKANTVEVDTYTLQTVEVSNQVECEGLVEQVGVDSVYLDVPVVVEQLNYEIGDYVAEGDVLMNVDVSATYAMLTAGAGMSQYYSADASQEVMSTYGLQGLSADSSEIATIPDKIYAPKSGILTGLNAVQGEVAGMYGSVAVISDMSDLQVKIAIDEKDVPKVTEGQSVVITGSGFDGEYIGKVKKIYPAARKNISGTATETVLDAIVSIEDSDEAIKPGFNVTANIDVSAQNAASILPYECIRQDENGQEYVYVYSARSAKRVDITTGEEFSNGTVVLSGLNIGDQVITNPDDIPSTGARVKLKEQPQ